MRLRIGDVMTLVMILAVGLAGVEWTRRAETGSPRNFVWEEAGPLLRGMYHAENRGLPFLSGMALSSAILIWNERVRRSPRRTWGVGRWSVSAIALYQAYLSLSWLCNAAIPEMLVGGRFAPGVLARTAAYEFHTTLNGDRSAMLIACWLSAKFAGWPGDPEPDALEWIGRLILVAAAVISIANALLVQILR